MKLFMSILSIIFIFAGCATPTMIKVAKTTNYPARTITFSYYEGADNKAATKQALFHAEQFCGSKAKPISTEFKTEPDGGPSLIWGAPSTSAVTYVTYKCD